MPTPIIIDTVFEHIANGYEVRATCHKCQRTVVVDLQALVRQGKDNAGLTSLRPWCTRCRTRGQWLRFPPSRHPSSEA